MEPTLELSPREIKNRLDKGEKIVLIDVREPQEFAAASIGESQLMPIQTIPAQLAAIAALATENTVALLCHHGMRSLNAATWLRQNGVANCISISGGIDRWSREIDASVPRY